MKRLFDILVSLFGLIFLSPLHVALVCAVRLNLGTPIFFKQKRPGLKGRPFLMYKFRSMRETKAKDGILLSDAERLTGFGQFLRKTSLDELPELWNVLKGEMSLVGPRPLLMEYLPLYSEKQARRHEVKPGMTGWAQVNGRNAIGWEEKFDLDVWYVDHLTGVLDLKILFKTIKKVLSADGVNQQDDLTMELFKGNNG